MPISKHLRLAITENSKLSEEQQNAIAARLLAELEDDQAWQSRFRATTDAQWDNLANLVRQEIESDHVVSLNTHLVN